MLLVKFVYFLDSLVHKTLRFQFPNLLCWYTEDTYLIFKLLAFYSVHLLKFTVISSILFFVLVGSLGFSRLTVMLSSMNKGHFLLFSSLNAFYFYFCLIAVAGPSGTMGNIKDEE